MGYHHCYGDPPDEASGHGKHWMEPKDASAMVRLTNAMLDHITRPVGWVHMPVPIERADDAYFEPPLDLRLSEDTELYLGLVHFEDGVAGNSAPDRDGHLATWPGSASPGNAGLGPRAARRRWCPTLQIHHDVDVPIRR